MLVCDSMKSCVPSRVTYMKLVSCPDLYSPAAKNGLGTIKQTARPYDVDVWYAG